MMRLQTGKSEARMPTTPTPAIRRLLILSLLTLRPRGMTLAELSAIIDPSDDVPPKAALDVMRLTNRRADLYQDDCPVDCDADVCRHAPLRLLDPGATAAALQAVAEAVGLGSAAPRLD